jgi:hypothetical protein
MGAGGRIRQMGPAHDEDVPVRSVSFEEVLEARWDIPTSQLLDKVIVPGKAFEVSLDSIGLGLVRFRSRAYRYATSRELQAHVVQTATKSTVRIYSHSDTDKCDLCKDVPPTR